MDRRIPNIIKEGKTADATNSQKNELFSLFHQADIEFELKNYLFDDLNHTKTTIISQPYFDGLFEKIWHNRKIELSGSHSMNKFLLGFTRVAAILIIGIISGYYINILRKTFAPVYYTSMSPKGSISEIYLPDGTHIFLNSGSELKYTIEGAKDKREIFLTGEAWFQVAKMKHNPFLVHTSFCDVQVTGTTFNVKAYTNDKEVVTTLEEGSVLIKSSKNLPLEKETVLKPGEQLIYNKESNDVSINQVNTRWYTAWKDNKLVFVNMSLKDLGILLERKYGVNIEIADKSILNYHYDGTIKNETILEVLEILQQTLPVQYHIVGQKIVIQKNKNGKEELMR